MDRRAFLKLASMTGIALFSPWGFRTNEAHAEGTTWGGPYFLHMHASGGWDPTMFCDAKVTAEGPTPVYENRVVTAVRDVNGIIVPTEGRDGPFTLRIDGNNGGPIEDPAHFFSTVGKDVLVLNGVDTQTNNHDTGVQALACGHNDVELPALAALFAGTVAKQRDVPMAFIAAGPYNRTGDVVGISRFPGDKVKLLVDPFRAAADDDNQLLSEVAVRRIQELRAKRLDQLQGGVTLPRTKRTYGATRDAIRGGESVNLLKSVVEAPAPTAAELNAGLAPATAAYLSAPVRDDSPVTRFADLGRPLETVLRCFQAGVTASATYAQGGFDTHGNHDVAQGEALGRFLARLRYVLLRSEQLGLKDKLFIMVTSDFGRTPRYNTGNGKDHWNVTSALLAGPGIRGGRAIGRTDEGHKVLRIARDNPTVTLPDSDANGARIHPAHIHHELRRVLGVAEAPFAGQFPLPNAPSYTPLPLLA
ncbi:MAG: DUF1501 domain-containing protein [Labilithrix sp.]|nr:DUF1501 domain-containing protein [Labilithrix sp.]MCW5811510.1 DUF1501 domain-containing protein [Labilithrix sp.]